MLRVAPEFKTAIDGGGVVERNDVECRYVGMDGFLC